MHQNRPNGPCGLAAVVRVCGMGGELKTEKEPRGFVVVAAGVNLTSRFHEAPS